MRKQELAQLKSDIVEELRGQSPPSSDALLRQTDLPRLSQRQILGVLQVDDTACSSALESIATAGRREEFHSTGLIRGLLQKPRFRAWLQSDTSETIFLRLLGDNDRITRLSVASAVLISSLKQSGSAVTIHYFCGLMRLKDLPGRYQLLRCLITQLLESWPPDRTFVVDLDLVRAVDFEFKPLWDMFLAALQSHDTLTVFCVIDGAVRYQDEEDLLYTIQCLVWLQHNMPAGVNVNLKLLLTSPAPSGLLRLIAPDDQILLQAHAFDHLALADGPGHLAVVGQDLDRERSRTPLPEQMPGYHSRQMEYN